MLQCIEHSDRVTISDSCHLANNRFSGDMRDRARVQNNQQVFAGACSKREIVGWRPWNLLTDDGGDGDGLCAARYIRRPKVDRFLSLGTVLRITRDEARA